MTTEDVIRIWSADGTDAPTVTTAARTLFAPATDRCPDALYVDRVTGSAMAERTRIRLEPHSVVSTDTYFGRFPAAYWQQWTRVADVTLRLFASGAGTVRLVASDSTGDPRTVASARVDDSGEWIELTGPLDAFADGGAMWLEATTSNGTLLLEDARWTVTGAVRRVGISVVICTHNRADDCLQTLLTLAADAETCSLVDAVHVVDQGTDPVESRARFAEARAELGPRLRYVRQPNLGGAGGFTRGIRESLGGDAGADGTRPNVLLMDDDIVLEPETVLRLARFADHTDAPVLVGAQMLQALHPHRLHVDAEGVDLARLRAGRPVPDAGHDLDVTTRGRYRWLDAQYNAWWTCLLPAEVVDAVGLPLPLFFQWDDIEYGLRARAAGYPTVTLAGAGVWHADFGWKDWDDWARFFSFRNALVVEALHGRTRSATVARHLFTELCRYIVAMQYGLAATLVAAVTDFCRGPDCLSDGGRAAADDVRALRGEYAETRRIPACGAPRPPQRPADPTPSRPGLVLCRRVVTHLLGRSGRAASVTAADAHWWHVALFAHAVVTDPSQGGVKVRHRDRALALRLARDGARVLLRLSFRKRSLGRRYRRAVPDLISPANWERLHTSPEPTTPRS